MRNTFYAMSMSHRIYKSRKTLQQMSCSEKCYQHSRFKQLKMSHNSREQQPLKPQTIRVLVDMDGVICDFEQSFLDKFREQHPNEPYIPLSERHGFYIDEQYSKIKPSLREKIWNIIEAEGFFRELLPIDGALEAIKSMSSMEGVDVFLCTSPLTTSFHSVKEKFEWIEQHLGWKWINKTIITKDKTIIAGDLLIDDRPVIKGAEKHPVWHHILFTTCHNKNINLSELSCEERLDNWTDGSWKKLIEKFIK